MKDGYQPRIPLVADADAGKGTYPGFVFFLFSITVKERLFFWVG